MALKIRQPDDDEHSKATDFDGPFQAPSPQLTEASTTGSPVSNSAVTGLPLLPPTGLLNAPPVSSQSEHGPVLLLRPSSTTDDTALVTATDPQTLLNSDLKPFLTTSTASPTTTDEPGASPPSQSSGFSTSQLVAAVLLPIIAMVFLLGIFGCVYQRRRRRRLTQLQPDREMKTLPSTTTSGWLPMNSMAEPGTAGPAPRYVQTQEPDVIPRRSPTMNSGYYSGLDQSAGAAAHRPPTATTEDPPPPYVPRSTAAPPFLTPSPPPLQQHHLQPATLSEANLVAHAGHGPISPFADPDTDAVSEISSLESESRNDSRRRRAAARDVDEISVVSAPDRESPAGMETRQIV
ncbi:hypothetical protein MMC16_001053 [Acarospora aff. strigata]|nr:hypothetical protein [Acarospora aff. strigata]